MFKDTLKEGIAAIVSLVILAVTAYMLWGTFASANSRIQIDAKEITDHKIVYDARRELEKDSFARQKDALQLGLSLLGAVLGFYLGRAPAERRAEQAEKTADAAQSNLGKAVDTAATAQGQAAASEQKAAAAQGQASLAQTKATAAEQMRAHAEQKVEDAKAVVAETKQLLASQVADPQRRTLGAGDLTKVDPLAQASKMLDDLHKRLS